MPATLPTFDVFRGKYGDPNAVWICAAEGLAAARNRMEALSVEMPGAYFVCNVTDRIVVAIADTQDATRQLHLVKAIRSVKKTGAA